MIVLRNKSFSIRPYAKKLISESERLIAQGKDKWEVARFLGNASSRYYKDSIKVRSLNPFREIKRSKDSDDSSKAISRQIGRVLQGKNFSMTKTEKKDLKEELLTGSVVTGATMVPLADKSKTRYDIRKERLADLTDNILLKDKLRHSERILKAADEERKLGALFDELRSLKDQVGTLEKSRKTRLEKVLGLAKRKHLKDQLLNAGISISLGTTSGLGIKYLHTLRDKKRREYFRNKREKKKNEPKE